eukprot:CAMPEP_0179266578 /NCGR_PEP_ID=MMETSP0797-20121207/29488_1 /TAXON_ID=47934 /ORGANISM="Dinophysis acuminata, Strain DAEP01" /LENGTH=408 /DNA_ID=CAMNT_0020974815 /DNA_START=14 /DNA_END=1237 /DNA_ORIENTATION=+
MTRRRPALACAPVLLAWQAAALAPSVGPGAGLGLPTERCGNSDLQSKDLDILMYGVTGYIGTVAAFYLAREHRENPRWAIAARNAEKLRSLSDSIRQATDRPPMESIRLLLGDDEETLWRTVRRARTVINFAGPYEPSNGEALIRAALTGCAHYVDLASEMVWRAQMIAKYEQTAEWRGLAVVQGAGFASLAGDFLATAAVQDAIKQGAPPPTAVRVVWSRLNGAFSGGRIAAGHYEDMHHGLVTDPYILAPKAAAHQRVDTVVDGMGAARYDQNQLQMSRLSATDCPTIRRSLTAMLPGAAISVQMADVPTLASSVREFLGTNVSERLADPPPGKGPPLWELTNGGFQGAAVTFSNRTRTKVVLKGRGDPHCLGSAKMSVELALGLAQNGPEDKRGGFLTPALALGL